jgi:hypothetical protein
MAAAITGRDSTARYSTMCRPTAAWRAMAQGGPHQEAMAISLFDLDCSHFRSSLKADIAQYARHDANVPTRDSCIAANSGDFDRLYGAFDAQFDFTAQRAARSGVSAPILRAALCNLRAYEINRSHKMSRLNGGRMMASSEVLSTRIEDGVALVTLGSPTRAGPFFLLAKPGQPNPVSC